MKKIFRIQALLCLLFALMSVIKASPKGLRMTKLSFFTRYSNCPVKNGLIEVIKRGDLSKSITECGRSLTFHLLKVRSPSFHSIP